VPAEAVVIGLNETIEPRWGPKIAARGIYRDPVRSSRGHFVKACAGSASCCWRRSPGVWALPVLTTLVPSQRHADAHGRRHKRLPERARQLLSLTARWLPGRQVIASTYAVIDLLAAVRHRLTVITRLRLDARLFDPAPPRPPGTRSRPRTVGARQPTLAEPLADAGTAWQRVVVAGWYGRGERWVDIVSGTAVWYQPGRQVPIR
jgi:hypothetical protein